jgi:hypothetical protein
METEEVEIDKPDSFTPAKWIEWHEGLMNYLQQKKGHAGVALAYVIRIEPNPHPERLANDPVLASIYHAPLQGVNYRKDSRAVYRVIKQLTLNTVAWNVLKRVEEQQDGRVLITALRDHYDGPQARLTRITQAQRLIRALHYKGEQSQSFSVFANKLIGAYNVLEKYGQAPTEEMRVTDLVLKLKGVTDPFVKNAVSSVFLDPVKRNDFHLAINTIAESIACTMGKEGLTKGEQRSLMSLEAKAQAKEQKKKAKGGDSDDSDYVPYSVWKTYSPEKQEQIRKKREAAGIKSKKKKRKQRSVSSVEKEEQEEASTAGDAFGRKSKKVRFIQKIRSFDRRATVASVNAVVDDVVYQEGRVEIDNHADTHALGPNCRVIFKTGRTCTVSGFTDQLDAITNVDIVTGATAWDDPDSGETWILVMNEALWFGDAIKTTLLNPNQSRHYGIKVQDDPTHRRPVSIYDPVTEVVIPMEMKGTIAGFKTRTPTDEDLEKCPRIVLSCPQPWDPESVVWKSDGSVISAVSVASEVEELARSCISSAISRDRHSVFSAEEIAKKWRTSPQMARQTLEATTQLGVRHAVHPLKRRYRTDTSMLGHRRLRYRMDTMFNKVKSLKGYKCAQVFCAEGYVKVIPMESKAEVGQALQELIHDVGIPNQLLMDGSGEQVGPKSDFSKACKKYDIVVYRTEPYTPRQNKTERTIGELRRRWRSLKASKYVLVRLWDYGLIYEAVLMSRMSKGSDSRPGIEVLTGDTVDISEWLDFEFYDLVWYWHLPGDDDNPRIGRWLGVAHRIGSDMCYWILTLSGHVIARTTVQHITEVEQLDPVVRQRVVEFTAEVDAKLDDKLHIDRDGLDLVPAIQDEPWEDEQEDLVDVPEFTEEAYDEYVGAELFIPSAGELIRGRVTKRLKDARGNPVGTRSDNPIFDSRDYEAVLDDVTTRQYSANLISEYMQSRMDPDGVEHSVFRAIVDHRESVSGDKPVVWSFAVEWADGSTSWVPYKQLRISNPVELAMYIQDNRLSERKPFVEWVPAMVRQQQRVISAAKKK